MQLKLKSENQRAFCGMRTISPSLYKCSVLQNTLVVNVILCCQWLGVHKDKAQFHSGSLLATGVISEICIFVSTQRVPKGLKAPLKIDAVDWLSRDWLCI